MEVQASGSDAADLPLSRKSKGNGKMKRQLSEIICLMKNLYNNIERTTTT